MNYRDMVNITHKKAHCIELYMSGTTRVYFQMYDKCGLREENKALDLTIAGDYGEFHYFWPAIGKRSIHSFLAGLSYDYAMGKMCGGRSNAYRDDWGSINGILKEEVIEMRKAGELTQTVARVLYDYFDDEYQLDDFYPDSMEGLYHALHVDLYPDSCRKSRRAWAEADESAPFEVVPMDVLGYDSCELPAPKQERAHPYFWDEVWPVIVEEIGKVERGESCAHPATTSINPALNQGATLLCERCGQRFNRAKEEEEEV